MLLRRRVSETSPLDFLKWAGSVYVYTPQPAARSAGVFRYRIARFHNRKPKPLVKLRGARNIARVEEGRVKAFNHCFSSQKLLMVFLTLDILFLKFVFLPRLSREDKGRPRLIQAVSILLPRLSCED